MLRSELRAWRARIRALLHDLAGQLEQGKGAGLERIDAHLERLNAQSLGLEARLADFACDLVLLHMPERLIFGGGVSKAPGLIEALRRRTEERLAGYVAHPALDPGLERYLTTPALGDDAGIRGAIELGRRMLPAQ